MRVPSKLYYKYMLSSGAYSFVYNLAQKAKNTSLLISASLLTYSALHLRSATLFHSSQLCDIFSYELPTALIDNQAMLETKQYNKLNKAQASSVVYNFHSFHSQDRYFLFVQNAITGLKSAVAEKLSFSDSIAELFPAGNWLEREVAELNGNVFLGKKDMRNLMLQFGDVTAPLQKSFPTIGLRDMFYDPVKQTLVQGGSSIQG